MKSVLIAGCAVLMSAMAAPAVAQNVTQPPVADADATAFRGTANDLPAAVESMEAAGGGKVMEIRFAIVDGVPGFNVVLARQGALAFMRVANPMAGLVALTAKSEPAWMTGWQTREAVKVVRNAPVSLATAIRTAEAANGGAPAVAAGLASSATSPATEIHAYNVLLLVGGSTQRVAVDSQTGLIIADPSALGNWP
jgi:hypothetical protein